MNCFWFSWKHTFEKAFLRISDYANVSGANCKKNLQTKSMLCKWKCKNRQYFLVQPGFIFIETILTIRFNIDVIVCNATYRSHNLWRMDDLYIFSIVALNTVPFTEKVPQTSRIDTYFEKTIAINEWIYCYEFGMCMSWNRYLVRISLLRRYFCGSHTGKHEFQSALPYWNRLFQSVTYQELLCNAFVRCFYNERPW